MPTAPIRIAIAGLGTVGLGTLKLLLAHRDLYALRAQRELQVVAVSSRDKTKDRGVDLSAIAWEENPLVLAARADVDVVIETIGGAEGTAKSLVEASLAAGKHVVTANKALLATHGIALAQLAEKHGVTLAFEAAVAGGIPIIKTMREGLSANQCSKVVGILNGTSNYILTQMHQRHCSFDVALKEAQELGYAEADPTFDVDGFDTAQKLSLLTALAFGCYPAYKQVYIEGIRNITSDDMAFAATLGYGIKLLGICERSEQEILQRVHPCMLPLNSPVGVDDVFNAIVLEGDAVGRVTLEGRGAGAGPTASSVVSDMLDIARGYTMPTFQVPVSALKTAEFASIHALQTAYYVRMEVKDQPGVLASITSILGEHEISVASLLQRNKNRSGQVPVVMTTHQTSEAAMQRAIQQLTQLDAVIETPQLIRMETNL